MPILLTTPWNPGNYDPGKTYPRAKIVTFTNNTERKAIRVTVDFGDEVEGKWVSGVPDRMRGRMGTHGHMIDGSAYDTMVAASPDEGETVYDAVKRLLYAYLVANVPELAGTVE